MTLDIDKTTYHETNEGIWRIDSGTDYGEVWDMDVFEQHAVDYGDEEPYRDNDDTLEILEADLDGREYRMIKDNETNEFKFMFYKELEDIDNPQSYINSIWEREVNTILNNTARTKMILKHELEGSDDTYKKRMSSKI